MMLNRLTHNLVRKSTHIHQKIPFPYTISQIQQRTKVSLIQCSVCGANHTHTHSHTHIHMHEYNLYNNTLVFSMLQFEPSLNLPLETVDPELFDIIEHEKHRQYSGLQLIPSEVCTIQCVCVCVQLGLLTK